MPHKRYQEVASHALAGFQLIEGGLKDYIGIYHGLVRKLLPSGLAYKYSRKDVEEVALGRLINIFSKLSTNDALVGALRAQVALRDELAHRAFLNLYGHGDNAEDLISQTDRLVDVAQQIVGLLEAIHNECKTLARSYPQ